jgi:hypothetical protein
MISLWIMAILPMVENWGVLAANTVAALLGWLSFV